MESNSNFEKVYIILGDTWVDYEGGQTWIVNVFRNKNEADSVLEKLKDLADSYTENSKAKRKVHLNKADIWNRLLQLDEFCQVYDDNLEYSMEERVVK